MLFGKYLNFLLNGSSLNPFCFEEKLTIVFASMNGVSE